MGTEVATVLAVTEVGAVLVGAAWATAAPARNASAVRIVVIARVCQTMTIYRSIKLALLTTTFSKSTKRYEVATLFPRR